MIFGKGERRRTERTSNENLPKSAEIAAFWQGSYYSCLAWCHLSRFNGRAYSRKGGLPRSIYNNVFARPPVGRGNPEDWRENAHTAAPPFIAGILHCVQNDTFGRVGSGGLI